MVLVAIIGVAFADQIPGRIVKIDGTKISFEAFDKSTKKFGEAKEYTVVNDVKVMRKKKGESLEVKGGLNAKTFQKLGKGRGAVITTNNNGQVTEIMLSNVGSGKKKKKNQ